MCGAKRCGGKVGQSGFTKKNLVVKRILGVESVRFLSGWLSRAVSHTASTQSREASASGGL
jgi:hypothetical protein